jgi:nucleoside-diphosphate-sugar epimerase
MHILVVGAAGGLGRAIVRESLSRGHATSVAVRSREKLTGVLAAELPSLLAVFEGDAASSPAFSRAACAGVDTIICAAAPNPALARVLGETAAAAQARVVWTAGSSNILEADGKTMHYKAFGPMGEGFYAAHTPCIAALKATGATHIIWCPGLMKSKCAKSASPPPILLHAAPAGTAPMDFISYEDAADVLLRAVETREYDNLHIAAVAGAP